jgi:hypothetical protein
LTTGWGECCLVSADKDKTDSCNGFFTTVGWLLVAIICVIVLVLCCAGRAMLKRCTDGRRPLLTDVGGGASGGNSGFPEKSESHVV